MSQWLLGAETCKWILANGGEEVADFGDLGVVKYVPPGSAMTQSGAWIVGGVYEWPLGPKAPQRVSLTGRTLWVHRYSSVEGCWVELRLDSSTWDWAEGLLPPVIHGLTYWVNPDAGNNRPDFFVIPRGVSRLTERRQGEEWVIQFQ